MRWTSTRLTLQSRGKLTALASAKVLMKQLISDLAYFMTKVEYDPDPEADPEDEDEAGEDEDESGAEAA